MAGVDQFQGGGEAGIFGEVSRFDQFCLHGNAAAFQGGAVPGGALVGYVDAYWARDVGNIAVPAFDEVFNDLAGSQFVFALDDSRRQRGWRAVEGYDRYTGRWSRSTSAHVGHGANQQDAVRNSGTCDAQRGALRFVTVDQKEGIAFGCNARVDGGDEFGEERVDD